MLVMPWTHRPECLSLQKRADIISLSRVWVGPTTSKFSCRWRWDRPIGSKSEKPTEQLGTLWHSSRLCSSPKAIKFVWFTFWEQFTTPMATISATLLATYSRKMFSVVEYFHQLFKIWILTESAFTKKFLELLLLKSTHGVTYGVNLQLYWCGVNNGPIII